MSTSATRRASGFTMLEMMVAMTILAVVVLVFTSTIKESFDAGKIATTNAELHANAQAALAQIVKDMRSTQARYVDLTTMTASPRQLKFRPITGVSTTAPYYTVAGANQQTIYSWNPSLTTGGWGASANWALSTLILTPWDKQSLQVKLAGEVTDFRVTALGTTATSGFVTTQPQTFEILLALSRRGLFDAPTASNPNGRLITVTVTTRVTIPG